MIILKEVKHYICEICGTEYNDKTRAQHCERWLMVQNRNTRDKRKIELLTNTYSIQNNITQKKRS